MKGEFYQSNEHYFFFESTLYEEEKDIADYLLDFLTNKELFISKLKGEFLLFYYNCNKNRAFFATDKLGKELGLYYYNSKNIVITNSFWEGVDIINPNQSDIDIQAVKELIVFNRALLHKTIIHGYNFLPPATLLDIEFNDKIIVNKKKYWDFKFRVDHSLELDAVVNQINSIFSKTFKILKEKYSEKTRFGVGLSGGLDSRLIAHYAKKNKIKIVPYCIGEKYSIFPIKTNGYKVANKIADFFQLDNFKYINYNSENYYVKINNEVFYVPFNPSNISISCLSKIPEFDVMLNGEHGGVFFGEFDFRPILNYSKDTINEYLLTFLCFPYKSEHIMSQDEKNVSLEKVKRYIGNIETNDRYEIFYKFFFEIYGSKSKDGFFESNYGLKKRYSPFLSPLFLEYFLTWDSKFMIDRVLQKALFKKHYTDLAKIEDERFDAPIYWTEDSPQYWPKRYFYALKAFLKKPGLRRGYWLKNDNEFKQLSQKILLVNKDFFDLSFPNMNFNLYLKQNPRAAANFIKMKVVIDIIIDKAYKEIKDFMKRKYL